MHLSDAAEGGTAGQAASIQGPETCNAEAGRSPLPQDCQHLQLRPGEPLSATIFCLLLKRWVTGMCALF